MNKKDRIGYAKSIRADFNRHLDREIKVTASFLVLSGIIAIGGYVSGQYALIMGAVVLGSVMIGGFLLLSKATIREEAKCFRNCGIEWEIVEKLPL